jgi:hypothetical protein
VKSERRDHSRRITPELMAFYQRRARQLREEAYVDAMRALWALLKKIVARR